MGRLSNPRGGGVLFAEVLESYPHTVVVVDGAFCLSVERATERAQDDLDEESHVRVRHVLYVVKHNPIALYRCSFKGTTH